MSTGSIRPSRRRQQGVVLFVSLILLLVLTVLGVTLARMQTVEERMAQNEDNHQLAFQSAEAALRASQIDLQTGELSGGIINISDFANNTAGQFSLGSEVTAAPNTSIADSINWSAPAGATLPYDGPPLTGAAGAPVPAPAQAAQFLIEQLPDACVPGCSCSANGGGVRVYRITAHAVGPDGNAGATLQTVYRSC